MKRCLIIAGPNGAGKTTFARAYLPNEGKITHLFNADLIAAGLMPFAPDEAAGEAGRLYLKQINDAFERGIPFAVETTLSGRGWLRYIRKWRKLGYEFNLIYLKPASVKVSIERVKLRVSQGGHNIPEDVIRRRFERSLANLATHQKAVDNWAVWDTSTIRPRSIEYQRKGYGGRDLHAFQRAAWKVCCRALRDNRPLPKWEDGQVLPTIPNDEIATLEELMEPDQVALARRTLHTSLY